MLTFERRHSLFAPEFTYAVRDDGCGWYGEVARNAGSRWYASNKTWTSGGDLDGTWPTRRDAAEALVAAHPARMKELGF